MADTARSSEQKNPTRSEPALSASSERSTTPSQSEPLDLSVHTRQCPVTPNRMTSSEAKPASLQAAKLVNEGEIVGNQNRYSTMVSPSAQQLAMDTHTSQEGGEEPGIRNNTQEGTITTKLPFSTQDRYFPAGETFIVLDALPRNAESTSRPITPVDSTLEISLMAEGSLDDSWTLNTLQDRSPGTSTPIPVDDSDAPWQVPDPLLYQALKKEGIQAHLDIPTWMTKPRGYSLQILHDGTLNQWPQTDRKCSVIGRDISLKQWIRMLRAGEFRLRGHSVVLAFTQFKEKDSVCQLKNMIALVIRAIRAVKEYSRVYIVEDLPVRVNPVLGLRVHRYNQILAQALKSLRITHDLEKVFLIEMADYFTDSFPWTKNHLLDNGSLTRTGCIHYRANLMREVGLQSY